VLKFNMEKIHDLKEFDCMDETKKLVGSTK
jgi:hypothetical protein